MDSIRRRINKHRESLYGHEYPPEWDHSQDVDSGGCLVTVAAGAEYDMVAARFGQDGFTSTITRIERVQNCNQWEEYVKRRNTVRGLNGGDANEALMIHGTSKTDPREIYANPLRGFSSNYSRDSCMYGRGVYFAYATSYSDNSYAHVLPSGERQLFVAKVTRGLVEQRSQSDTSIKVPAGNHNSVEGPVGSTRAIILYDVNQAYPAYLVTYRK
eukprot:gnl/Spiro4/16863_TR9077_c0_g2_i1.p1 gnl/Spiro4/16863_TR9077_c0_g2~~gnl/Spiro4/16863_TR9077_c0_g2_i1.p1  ORF type:complete len:230 (+),score=31.67 gnl/Spiro4/16863_TR9077_c0_g2_i1:50-691(+)